MPEMIIPPANLAEWMRWMESRMSQQERRLEWTPDDGLTGDDIDVPPVEYSWSAEGVLDVEVGPHRLYNDTGGDRYIELVRAAVGTAPTGDDLIVMVNLNGAPISTVGVVIASGSHTDTNVPDIASLWTVGDYLTVDVTQVGSAVHGSDLTVTVVTT